MEVAVSGHYSVAGYQIVVEAQVAGAALQEDADERLRAVRTLVAEETRLGMLVGVAVGLELAEELANTTERGEDPSR